MPEFRVEATDNPAVADTSGLVRIYFDNSHWNNLFRHSHRRRILRKFDRSREAVFPSVVNAAELLNTRDPCKRRRLCGTARALLNERHAVLNHPDYLLVSTADAFRRGESLVTVGEGSAAKALRGWIEHPSTFDAQARRVVRDWTDALDGQIDDFRSELDQIIGDQGFLGDAETLVRRLEFAALLFDKVPMVTRAAQSAQEVFDLIQGCSAWAAFAGSVAYEFSNEPPSPHRNNRPRMPEGSDMAQIIYLGFVNIFVTDDRRFRSAVSWVAGMLPAGVQVDVLSSKEYFERIGYAL